MSRKSVKFCSVKYCSNSSAKSNISFFQYPKDIKRAKLWVMAACREDLLSRANELWNKADKICGIHFEEKYFLNDLRNRLHTNAVPTIFFQQEGRNTDHTYSSVPYQFVCQDSYIQETIEDSGSKKLQILQNTTVSGIKTNPSKDEKTWSTMEAEGEIELDLDTLTFIRRLDAIDYIVIEEAVNLDYIIILDDANDLKHVSKLRYGKVLAPSPGVIAAIEKSRREEKDNEILPKEVALELSNVRITHEDLTNANLSITTSIQKSSLPQGVFSTMTLTRNCELNLLNSPNIRVLNLSEKPRTWQKIGIRKGKQMLKHMKGKMRKTRHIEAIKARHSEAIKTKQVVNDKTMKTKIKNSDTEAEKQTTLGKPRSISYTFSGQVLLGPPFHCDKCSVSYNKYENYLNHRAKVKHSMWPLPPTFPHNCTQCDAVLETVHQYRAHMTQRHRKKSYVCSVCKKGFKNKLYLNNHSAVHSDEARYECKICNKKFKFLTSLKRHLPNHDVIKPFICSGCGRGFTQKTYLEAHERLHVIKEHFNVGSDVLGNKNVKIVAVYPRECYKCGVYISNRAKMLEHYQENHNAENSTKVGYRCQLCGQVYTSNYGLEKHLRIHARKRSFECEICLKLLSSRHILNSHLAMHEGNKKCICEICGKALNSALHLKVHIMRHTGERNFRCDTCGKKFYAQGDLSIHIRIHTNEKRYDCEYCDKKFTHINNLKTHRKKHIRDGDRLKDGLSLGNDGCIVNSDNVSSSNVYGENQNNVLSGDNEDGEF